MNWSAVPYCGPGADPLTVWTAWNFDPPLLLALAALAGFIARRHFRYSQPAPRTRALAAAWAILFLLFVSPLCAVSAALFSVRVGAHIALVAVAAPLIAWATTPKEGRARTAPPLVAATGVHVLVFWAWHAPAPYAFALSHDAGYWLMQLSLLGSAIWFWRALIARRDRPVAVMTALTSFAAQMGLLGALIVFAPAPLFAPHFLTTAAWGLTPLEDQQLAGLLMWVPGVLPYMAILLANFAHWLREADGQA